MDVIQLQGVWLGYPAVVGARTAVVAGLYAHYVAEWRRRHRRGEYVRQMTAAELRRSLLKEVEARIVQQDADDLFVVLAA